MTDMVMTALITAASMILVQIIVSVKQQRTQDVKTDYVLKEVQNDIKRLETKQDKHNSLIERMTVVEQSTKSAHHRIDDHLERKDNIK